MAQLCYKPLRPNPFLTYRDPITGKWHVMKSAASSAPGSANRPKSSPKIAAS